MVLYSQHFYQSFIDEINFNSKRFLSNKESVNIEYNLPNKTTNITKQMMESFGFSIKTYLSSSLDCGETQSFYRFFGTIQIDTFPPVEIFSIEENHQVSPLITYIKKAQFKWFSFWLRHPGFIPRHLPTHWQVINEQKGKENQLQIFSLRHDFDSAVWDAA